jgi:hypothetical protein
MYSGFPPDINPGDDFYVDKFESWWMSLDAWIGTAEGEAWMANMEDAESTRCYAKYGSRPGLGSSWEGW